MVKSPVRKAIKSLFFCGVPWLSGSSAKMYFEILDAKTMNKIYSSKDAKMLKYNYGGKEADRIQ